MKLENKKIIFLGDSITEGHGTTGEEKTFHQIIKEKCEKVSNKLHLINIEDIINYTYNEDLQKFDAKQFAEALFD